jgi:Long-chain fatty acid transport protein
MVVILTIIPPMTFAQNISNSPYSRFGYGKLTDNSFASQRGMGGIGYGIRNSEIINSTNPASYSNIDSMTFMMDMGLAAQVGWYEDGQYKDRKTNGGLEYIAMQFPLFKRMGVGFGLEPISQVGYSYGGYEDLDNDDYVSYVYKGNGGLSQVYGGVSYNFFDKLSIGAKFTYLFGDIMHNNTASFNSTENYITSWRDTLRLNGFTYRLGLQYTQPIGKDQSVVVGAVYSPKIKVNGISKSQVLRINPSTGGAMTNEYTVFRDSVFEMPESYGIGFSFNKRNKYTLGIDAQYQKWSTAKFYDREGELNDLLKINMGGQYIPNYMNRNYLDQIRYRAGVYYSDSYLRIQNSGYKEYGVTVGLGLPTIDRRSLINISFDYSLLRPDINMVNEQFFKITLSYTFNEQWFFKRKVQ